jgi:D-alanyl-D-alanine carboxypeptidase (penicillin-binding protein 5/6)
MRTPPLFFHATIFALAMLLAANLTYAARTQSGRAPINAKAKGPAYKGAIVLDAGTGKVIFEDHADEISPPASMTKLMTFAVLNDKLRAGAITLATPVTVSAEDSHIGGTRVYLKEGETFHVEELIYAMMIESANDAAYALACKIAGSQEAFVELMNAKAQALGMASTTFRSSHGLPPESRKIADGDLTTPRDFSKLCQYLIANTDILKYTSVRQMKFGAGERTTGVIDMVNHNHLLGKVAGVDGFKTGYTKGAGYCLSTTALRNGRRIIVVTMGSADRKTRDKKIMELIEKGFAELPPLPPKPAAVPANVKVAATAGK